MKKLFFAAAIAVFGFTTVNAQDDAQNGSALSKGSWVIEANTGFGASSAANTNFNLTSQDGTTTWGLGGEVGYFVADDLAVKVGLGYNDLDYTSSFSYKVGAKYYVSSIIPVQIDLAGASIKDFDENPLWLGIQGGYAIFVADNISIEPGLRYNLSLNDDYTDEGVLQFNVGFALHF
jgi:hypothetical protein